MPSAGITEEPASPSEPDRASGKSGSRSSLASGSLLGPGKRRRERLQGRDRRLARPGQADLHRIGPASDDRPAEPEPRRLGEDQGRAAGDPGQSESAVGVGRGRRPPRPVARLRDRGPWHGLPFAVDDPARDDPDAPRPLEGEVGKREEVSRRRREPRPCDRARIPSAATSIRNSLGFRSSSFGVLNEPSGPVLISAIVLEPGLFGEAREVVSRDAELHLDGNPAQRRPARPEHATGHGEDRRWGRSRPSPGPPCPLLTWSGLLLCRSRRRAVIDTVDSGPSPFEDEPSLVVGFCVDAAAAGASPSGEHPRGLNRRAGDGPAGLVDDLSMQRRRGRESLPALPAR